MFGFECRGVEPVSTKIAEDKGVPEDFEPTRLKSLGPIVRSVRVRDPFGVQ